MFNRLNLCLWLNEHELHKLSPQRRTRGAQGNKKTIYLFRLCASLVRLCGEIIILDIVFWRL